MKCAAQEVHDRWSLFNADTVEVARSLPDRSVDFAVYSPPFSSLYVYSASSFDMGNVRDDAAFFEQYDFLVREQARVMKPGRLIAIHCMTMPLSRERDGVIGLKDFRGDLVRAHQRRGFIFHSEVCLWKDPVTQMQRTKALGLLHKQIRKDSAMSRQGLADYLVIMRTPGQNPEPIAHTSEEFPVERWQRYASPVWATLGAPDDEGFAVCSAEETSDPSSGINPSNTLQARSAREHEDERHLAPLQLEVIRRAINLWTNKGDIVWSPFAGIGSEGVVALEMGRRFIGAELKSSYYRQAVANLKAAREGGPQLSLFKEA